MLCDIDCLHVRSHTHTHLFSLALVRDRPHAKMYGYDLIRLGYYSPSFDKDKCSFKLAINFDFP